MDEELTSFINNFDEVYSIYIELIFLDYLKYKKYLTHDVNVSLSMFANQTVSYLDNLKFEKYMNRADEGYSYGYVLAYHFYEQYLKDKDMAKCNITKFMLESKDHDKFYMLNNYGLNQNDILNPQKIEKHMKKSLIKIS
jgi:hypothetical protein